MKNLNLMQEIFGLGPMRVPIELKRLEKRKIIATEKEVTEHIFQMISNKICNEILDEDTCCLLSGGLDSSIVTAIAQKNYYEKFGRPIRTYSFEYKESPNEDKPWVEKVSKYLKTEHTYLEIGTDELIENLFKAVDARRYPGMADIDSSLLAFLKLISEKSFFTGEGADEVFGGYWWMQTEENFETFPWSNVEAREWFLKEIPIKDYVQKHFNETYVDNQKLTIDWFMPVLVDRTKKIAAYTGKVPLMPYKNDELIQYVYNLKPEFKIDKYILRKVAEKLLPEEIVYRKKFPYPKTHNETYLKRVTEMLEDIINSNDEPINKFLDKEKVEKLLESKSNERPWFGQLMAKPQQIAYLLQINYWLKNK